MLFEFVDRRGWGVITEWELQTEQRAKLDAKLDMLDNADFETAKQILRGIRGYGGLFKIRIQGRVQLRPIMCYGPLDTDKEITFLLPAREIGGDWNPRDAPELALARMSELQRYPSRRRRYETDSGQTN